MILLSNVCILILVVIAAVVLSIMVGEIVDEIIDIVFNHDNKYISIGIKALFFIVLITSFVPKVCIWLF